MRRLGRFSVTLGTLAFAALPILASGCADTTEAPAPAGGTPAGTDTTADESAVGLDELSDDLGAPAESGSDLGFPESGSTLD
jgi:hypothetical protein